jgi:quercetin dioxygenase-like cupin family protein
LAAGGVESKGSRKRGVRVKAGKRRVAHLASGEGQTLRVLGELNTFKARYAAYTLLESTALPEEGSGLPPHVHHDQDEAIYVLEGEYALFVSGDEELRLTRGSFASVPRGTIHALEVTGSNPGRCLVILTPPGALERFFEEVGVRAGNEAPPRTHKRSSPARDDTGFPCSEHRFDYLGRRGVLT